MNTYLAPAFIFITDKKWEFILGIVFVFLL